MNSKLKSVGRIFRVTFVGLMVFVLGLAFAPAWALAADEAEVSLKEDRRSIEELRANIPPEIRSENDALKETLSLLGEVKDPPQKHREKFEKIMRSMREKKRKERQKERQEFSKNERKAREKFLKEMKSDRDDFMKRKVDRDKRKEFFDNQDSKRKEYFDAERDARKEFESSAREKEQDFNANYREKSEEFRKELRTYTDRYNDWQKHLKQKEREAKEAAAAKKK